MIPSEGRPTVWWNKSRLVLRKALSLADRLVPRNLMLRYSLALITIAVLITLEQIVIQLTLDRQTRGQRLMRVAERQEYEAGRLSRAALTAQLVSRDVEVRHQVQNIIELSEDLIRRHQSLLRDVEAYRQGWYGDLLLGQADRLQERFSELGLENMEPFARVFAEPGNEKFYFEIQTPLKNIGTAAPLYRKQIGALLSSLDRVIHEQMTSAKRTELFVFVLLICVLVFEGLYIFRPSIRGLETALRARSDFMSRMSHEIRNPMNAILGMVDILRETPLNEMQRRYLRTLEKSSETLLELLNSLLDFSALENGKARVERVEFDILETLGKVVDISAVRAHEKKLDVILDIDPRTPCRVFGDPIRIQQVVTNLLSNAIKFTSHGEVRLKVRPEISGDSEQYLEFTVSDTGIGINSESLSRIFESFVQADSSTRRKFGGTGLGLTISKELVRLMGGRLSVSSVVGSGSDFRFSIPVSIPPQRIETLEMRLSRYKLDGLTFLCLGPQSGSLLQAMSLILMCGGRVETRIEAVDVQSPRTVVLLSPHDHDSLIQFFPDCFPDRTRMLCLIGTVMSAARMRAYMEFGVSEFILTPLKPVEFAESVCRGIDTQQLALDDAVSRRTSEALSVPDKGPRILVADDSGDNRELIRLYLRSENVDLVFASDGARAVQRYQEGYFDLVLMDIQMPVLDGIEALEYIRKWEITNKRPPTPIIAVTADTRPEQRDELKRRGFDDFLAKPLRKSRLLATIRDYGIAAGAAHQRSDRSMIQSSSNSKLD